MTQSIEKKLFDTSAGLSNISWLVKFKQLCNWLESSSKTLTWEAFFYRSVYNTECAGDAVSTYNFWVCDQFTKFQFIFLTKLANCVTVTIEHPYTEAMAEITKNRITRELSKPTKQRSSLSDFIRLKDIQGMEQVLLLFRKSNST